MGGGEGGGEGCGEQRGECLGHRGGAQRGRSNALGLLAAHFELHPKAKPCACGPSQGAGAAQPLPQPPAPARTRVVPGRRLDADGFVDGAAAAQLLVRHHDGVLAAGRGAGRGMGEGEGGVDVLKGTRQARCSSTAPRSGPWRSPTLLRTPRKTATAHEHHARLPPPTSAAPRATCRRSTPHTCRAAGGIQLNAWQGSAGSLQPGGVPLHRGARCRCAAGMLCCPGSARVCRQSVQGSRSSYS